MPPRERTVPDQHAGQNAGNTGGAGRGQHSGRGFLSLEHVSAAAGEDLLRRYGRVAAQQCPNLEP